MSRPTPLASFSLLSKCYQHEKQQHEKQQQEKQQQEKQQQQQQQEKKKIKIKPKNTQVPRVSPVVEKQATIIDPLKKKKITIIIKKRSCRCQYNDIAPASSIFWVKKNEFYLTPPPKCCRFFIDNRQCFLREKDNACISPISKKVIGFWNEKVGKECKLLPVENETMYEEIVNDASHEEFILETASSSESTLSQELQESQESPPSQRQTNLKSPKSKNKFYIAKPKFVSDAQRARIASEPVALLREKLAKQYGIDGITKKN